MRRGLLIVGLLSALIGLPSLGAAQSQGDQKRAAEPAKLDLVVKRTFELPLLKTVGGKDIKGVKVGWEAYGTLNADKSNAILITHFFSGNSHAAGKYKEDDKAAGYWDAIIGPGKAIDTNKYYVLSSDTLVNLAVSDPAVPVVTTGPATINPDTGQRWGMAFPVVTIRDFVNVQKALVESLGIKKLHAVMGASMGALQAYEWASSYPAMVGRVVPVIGAGESDGFLIAWLDMWAAPIRLDPKWNKGDYYGREAPLEGLALSLKMVTLHAQHWAWTNGPAFGRKWAKADVDPANCVVGCSYLIESVLDGAGKGRAAASDANHFLYLVKANQLFVAGGGSLAEGLKRIDAPVLMISSDDDLVFHPDAINQTATHIRADGTSVEQVRIRGGRGHLDGVLAIGQAEKQIRAFMEK